MCNRPASWGAAGDMLPLEMSLQLRLYGGSRATKEPLDAPLQQYERKIARNRATLGTLAENQEHYLFDV